MSSKTAPGFCNPVHVNPQKIFLSVIPLGKSRRRVGMTRAVTKRTAEARRPTSCSAAAASCEITEHVLAVDDATEGHVVGYPAHGGVRRPTSVRRGHPGRPVRTGHSGNKVSAFQRALDAGGTAEPQRSTRCDYGAQQGALGQPHRALTNPSDLALIPRVRRDTGAAQRRCGFNELGFTASHEDGRDIVRVRGCVKTCSEIHAIAWSGNGRARHGGPLDLELHVGVLGRPRAVRGVAGLEV